MRKWYIIKCEKDKKKYCAQKQCTGYYIHVVVIEIQYTHTCIQLHTVYKKKKEIENYI